MSRGGIMQNAYAERWSPARRLLCLCVKAERSAPECESVRQLHGELGNDAATVVAARNQCEPIVAHGLADAGIHEQPWDEWHENWCRRIRRMMALLDEIAGRATKVSIPVVVLKNGAIARALHPCPGCVPMGDLDLLVRRSDFGRMDATLRALGFSVVSGGTRPKSVEAGLRKGGLDYALRIDGETYAIDLQWRPVSGRWLRADQEPTADELIDRSTAVAGSDVRVLATTDNLVQIALHTAKHSYVRAPGFRLHLDVERVVHWTAIDWSAVVEEARRLRVPTAVFLSLSIPRGLFNAAIPDWVLHALDPGPARRSMLYRWLQRVSVFDPDRPKFGRLGQLVFHLALAEGAAGLWKTLFPPSEEMRERFNAGETATSLVMAYGRRFADIAFHYQR
jgi:hypothetical protein